MKLFTLIIAILISVLGSYEKNGLTRSISACIDEIINKIQAEAARNPAGNWQYAYNGKIV